VLRKPASKGKAAAKTAEAPAAKAATEEDLDKAFIASDDDNADLAEEYNQQKEYESDADPYNDDDDMAEEDSAKPRGAAARGGDAPEEELEEGSFKAVLKNINQRRNAARQNKLTDSDLREKAHSLVREMHLAVSRDNAARARKRPAIYKLELLDKVVLSLLRSDLQPHLLDAKVLDGLAEWMRPSQVDKTLPAQTIRTRIIEILPQVNITLHNLENNRLFGKVMAYLSKHPKELRQNRDKLTELIRRWSREIFTAAPAAAPEGEDADAEMATARPSAPKPRKTAKSSAAKSARSGGGFDSLVQSRHDKSAEFAAEDKNSARARIPQPLNFDFKRAPQNNIRGPEDPSKSTNLRPSAKRIELEKKLVKARKKRSLH